MELTLQVWTPVLTFMAGFAYGVMLVALCQLHKVKG